MNRISALSVIFLLGTSVACDAAPETADKDDATGDVSDGVDDDVGDAPTDDPDSSSDDASSDDDDADLGDTGDFGDTDDSEDSSDTDDTDPGFDREPASAAAFEALTDDARAERVQVHTVDASFYVYLVGEQGTILNIPSGSIVDADREPVIGSVDIELVELYDKGSMLVTDMPSTGLNGDGDRAQLISGGEHYINATQDGEQLQLAQEIRIDAPVANTGDVSTDMTRFRAVTVDGDVAGLDDAEVWIEEDAKVEIGRAEAADGVQTTYSLLTAQFGWTNVDRWYSDPREKTSLEVRPPVGWDDSNSAVYLSYDGEPTALAGLDTFDADEGIFSEHYGLIPVGLEVHVNFVHNGIIAVPCAAWVFGR